MGLNPEIYRSASVMMDHFGERAATEATELARRMHARGDFHGYWVWLKIVSAIGELRTQTSPQLIAPHRSTTQPA